MENIKKVIDLYAEGTRTGNRELLESLFHKEAVMSGDLGEKKLVLGSPTIFFNDVEGENAGAHYNYDIVAIEKCGDIAIARLKESGLKGHDFMNLFQLQKVEGQWKIISKLFTTMDKGTYESC